MRTLCQIGLDITKENFKVHGAHEHGKDVLVKRLKRKDILAFFAYLPSCRIGIEACGMEHYWCAKLASVNQYKNKFP